MRVICVASIQLPCALGMPRRRRSSSTALRDSPSRVTASVKSPETIVASAQSADGSEAENTTSGMSFIGLANGPEAPGQKLAQLA